MSTYIFITYIYFDKFLLILIWESGLDSVSSNTGLVEMITTDIKYINSTCQLNWYSQWGLGWVGKVCSLCAPYLSSISVARRSPLVSILSEGWPPHTVLGWALLSWSRCWLSARGCNITINTPFFVSKKKKKNWYKIYIYIIKIFMFVSRKDNWT